MRTITARTLAGRDWQVRVVWQPRWRALAGRFGGWRRKRKARRDGVDVGDVPGSLLDFGDDFFVAIAIVVGMIVFGLLFWWLLLPLVLLLVDIVVVILLLLLAIPARVLFRRPWTVEAVSADGPDTEQWFATDVVGWRNALAKRDEIAVQLISGVPAPVVGTLNQRES